MKSGSITSWHSEGRDVTTHFRWLIFSHTIFLTGNKNDESKTDYTNWSGKEKSSGYLSIDKYKELTCAVVLVIDEMTKRNVGLNCKNQSREGCDLGTRRVIHVKIMQGVSFYTTNYETIQFFFMSLSLLNLSRTRYVFDYGHYLRAERKWIEGKSA